MTQESKTVDEVREMAAKPKRSKSHRDKERPIYVPHNAHATRKGNMVRLVLPVPISANSYWRSRVVVSPGKEPISVTYLSAMAKAYKAVVKKIGENCQPFRGPVRVTARVFRARRAGDLDNTIKVTIDSIQGIALASDSQVCECHWHQDLDRDNPRIEIEIVSVQQTQKDLIGKCAATTTSAAVRLTETKPTKEPTNAKR